MAERDVAHWHDDAAMARSDRTPAAAASSSGRASRSSRTRTAAATRAARCFPASPRCRSTGTRPATPAICRLLRRPVAADLGRHRAYARHPDAPARRLHGAGHGRRGGGRNAQAHLRYGRDRPAARPPACTCIFRDSSISTAARAATMSSFPRFGIRRSKPGAAPFSVRLASPSRSAVVLPSRSCGARCSSASRGSCPSACRLAD